MASRRLLGHYAVFAPFEIADDDTGEATRLLILFDSTRETGSLQDRDRCDIMFGHVL